MRTKLGLVFSLAGLVVILGTPCQLEATLDPEDPIDLVNHDPYDVETHNAGDLADGLGLSLNQLEAALSTNCNQCPQCGTPCVGCNPNMHGIYDGQGKWTGWCSLGGDDCTGCRRSW